MEPILLIHGYSSESAGTDESSIRSIFGTLPDDLAEIAGAGNVIPVNVSRYVTLDDGVTIDDLSLSLDRVLQTQHPDLLKGGFNVIIHSTGALVIRNWVRRFSPRPSPVRRIIHLAGANHGSGWAHIGESLLAKWGRFVFQHGAERGVGVLKALELASSWTIDLNRHFLIEGNDMLNAYRVMEFCLIGSQVPKEWMLVPFRYGKEDGSDGVIRVSSCNLNHHYIHIAPTGRARQEGWQKASDYAKRESAKAPAEEAMMFEGGYYAIDMASTPEGGLVVGGEDGVLRRVADRAIVPFGIPYECAHSTDQVGIVYGVRTREDVLPMLRAALTTTLPDTADRPLGAEDLAGLQSTAAAFDGLTKHTYERVANPQHAKGVFASLVTDALRLVFDSPQGQYDGHAQVVFRVTDQNGRPVDDFSVYFNSFGGSAAPQTIIDRLFEDQHRNRETPNCINFYLRTRCWENDAGTWIDRLPPIGGVDIEIDGIAADTSRVLYLPLRWRVSASDLEKWVQPNRTTIIDIELMRLPSDDTFLMPGEPG